MPRGLSEPLYYRRYRGFSSQFPYLEQMALCPSYPFSVSLVFLHLWRVAGSTGEISCARGRHQAEQNLFLLPGPLTPVVGPQKGHQPVARRVVRFHLSSLGQKGGCLGPFLMRVLLYLSGCLNPVFRNHQGF